MQQVKEYKKNLINQKFKNISHDHD